MNKPVTLSQLEDALGAEPFRCPGCMQMIKSTPCIHCHPENFADAPQTIGELKSDKTGNGKDWKPREVLINLLRSIDKGDLNPDEMVVVMSTQLDGKTDISMACATNNIIMTAGLLAHALGNVTGSEGEE